MLTSALIVMETARTRAHSHQKIANAPVRNRQTIKPRTGKGPHHSSYQNVPQERAHQGRAGSGKRQEALRQAGDREETRDRARSEGHDKGAKPLNGSEIWMPRANALRPAN